MLGKEQLLLEYILLILIGVMVIYILFNMIQQRRILKTLTEDQFREGYRKAQLIDVREPNEFDNGHILGARNIPLSQMKNVYKKSVQTSPYICTAKTRKDRPVPLSYFTKRATKTLINLKAASKNGQEK